MILSCQESKYYIRIVTFVYSFLFRTYSWRRGGVELEIKQKEDGFAIRY